MIEDALRYLMVTNSGISAITTRIYPIKMPDMPVYPLITYTRVSGMRDHHLLGPSGIAHPRVQIDTWADTYAGSKLLANAIRSCLDGYMGTVSGVKINSILINSEFDIYEDEINVYRVIQDYMIWHNE